jgi:acetyltransferase-like isoleucine patch superfamily enzyme
VRSWIIKIRRYYLVKCWGHDLGKDCEISFTAKLDRTYPQGVHIGDETIVTFGAVILTHDGINNRQLDTWIGKRCFIGARSFIMPGVRVGDNSIVGAGSVVLGDVRSGSIVMGNPARVLGSGIKTGPHGSRTPALMEKV